ncbi:MAG TPA: hypothetical protein ACFCUC_13795 [Desulfobacterales bacterium]
MDKMGFCHSCAAPLQLADSKGPLEKYCKYRTTEDGNIKSRDKVQRGIAEWFKSWQPNVDDNLSMERAEHYMQSMPHRASYTRTSN